MAHKLHVCYYSLDNFLSAGREARPISVQHFPRSSPMCETHRKIEKDLKTQHKADINCSNFRNMLGKQQYQSRRTTMRVLQIILCLNLTLFFTAAASAKIAFCSYQDREYHIYVMNDDGRNIKKIISYPELVGLLRWSPDGQQIAFVKDTDPSNRVTRNTFIMNADGTNVRQLTSHQGSDRGLAFSPDGKKLLVSRSLRGLHVIDIESGDTQQISNIRTGDIDWSPDGKQIIFLNEVAFQWEEFNLWIMNVDGTDARPWIPLNKTMVPYSPRWSPTGRHILYTETDLHKKDGLLRHAGTYRYIIRNADGSTPRRLAIPKNWTPGSVAWMNRSKSVLFSAIDFAHWDKPNHFEQLYRYDIATKHIRQLTHGPGDKWGEDWVSGAYAVSPAGKQSVRWGELKKAYSD